MMMRVCHAKDWGSGIELTDNMLGRLASLELHHVFPKTLLYEHDYKRPDVNAIANFTFLTKETNLHLTNRAPEDYFEKVMRKQPGTLQTHWIPMDRELWRVENYLEFLTARRELLAKAANHFLESLLAGTGPVVEPVTSVLEREAVSVPGGVETEEEERVLNECNAWVVERGLPEGELSYELADPESGELLAILDLAWPNGLQEGFSQPVALLIDEEDETVNAVNLAGFRSFTEPEPFREYVRREILALEPEAA